jgi:hypothetical protein
MVDLRVLAQKAYFHPDIKGSNFIKKALQVVLKTRLFAHPKFG